MDFKQIEGFVRVAELGSFTKAAQLLDTTQPALSRLIRMLEVDLRQTLLVRNGRGAVPTEAGQVLLEHGRGILHQVQRAREDLGTVRGGLAGRVAIGLPPSLARVFAVPLTRAFRAQLPDASLSISEGLTTQMQEWLVNGRLDIAVLYNARASADIDISPLGDEDLWLVQARRPGLAEDPPPGPVTLKQVAELPLVSHVKELGLIEARNYHQTACFEAGVMFARSEGIVPAPESTHAIRGAIDEALRCKAEGKSETILFCLSGHGHFDMTSYTNYLAGNLVDQDYDEKELAMALSCLPKVAA